MSLNNQTTFWNLLTEGNVKGLMSGMDGCHTSEMRCAVTSSISLGKEVRSRKKTEGRNRAWQAAAYRAVEKVIRKAQR